MKLLKVRFATPTTILATAAMGIAFFHLGRWYACRPDWIGLATCIVYFGCATAWAIIDSLRAQRDQNRIAVEHAQAELRHAQIISLVSRETTCYERSLRC